MNFSWIQQEDKTGSQKNGQWLQAKEYYFQREKWIHWADIGVVQRLQGARISDILRFPLLCETSKTFQALVKILAMFQSSLGNKGRVLLLLLGGKQSSVSDICKKKFLQSVSREVQTKSDKSVENISPPFKVWDLSHAQGEVGFSCCESFRMGALDDFILYLQGRVTPEARLTNFQKLHKKSRKEMGQQFYVPNTEFFCFFYF